MTTWQHIIFYILLTTGLVACTPTEATPVVDLSENPVISEPLVSAGTPVEPRQEIGISVDVANPSGDALSYLWTVDAGEIVLGADSPAIIYRAPQEAGTYRIEVTVSWDTGLVERTTFVNVGEVPPTETPTPTEEPSLAGTPSAATQTPVAEPTAVQGVVTVNRLNLREGPSVNYARVGRLASDEEIIILQRTPDGDWFEVQKQDGSMGWVSQQYIDIAEADIRELSVAQDLDPTPTNPPPPPTAAAANGLAREPFNFYGDRQFGTLPPFPDKWYTFTEGETPNPHFILLMVEPRENVEFFVYDANNIDWPPDPNSIDQVPNVGAGAIVPEENDRDGNLSSRELIWTGRLDANTPYYLRVVNNSGMELDFCLVTEDVTEWTCPR